MTSPNAKARRRHIHALTRRMDHLRRNLDADGVNPRPGRAYDIAELSALKAATEALKERYAGMAET